MRPGGQAHGPRVLLGGEHRRERPEPVGERGEGRHPARVHGAQAGDGLDQLGAHPEILPGPARGRAADPARGPAPGPGAPRRRRGEDQEVATSEQVRRSLTRSLTAWSVGSLAAGALLLAGRPGAVGTGVARQTLAWGAVDLGIAALSARGRPAEADEPRAAAALRRLLLLNAALDVGYVAAGAWLWRAGRVRGRDSRGDGAGVVVQGAFLLVLDAVHAARLRTTAV